MRADTETSRRAASLRRASAAGAGRDTERRTTTEPETRGGGITFGRHEIIDGKGDFSLISDIDEVFGNYATAEAHAGMGPSTGALVVTKGSVSLALSGTGNGVDVGVAFGRFHSARGRGRAARARRNA